MNSYLFQSASAVCGFWVAAVCLGPPARGDLNLNPQPPAAPPAELQQSAPTAAPSDSLLNILSYILIHNHPEGRPKTACPSVTASAPAAGSSLRFTSFGEPGLADALTWDAPWTVDAHCRPQPASGASEAGAFPCHVVRLMPPPPGSARLCLLGAMTAGVWQVLRASSRRFDTAAWFTSPVILVPFEVRNNPAPVGHPVACTPLASAMPAARLHLAFVFGGRAGTPSGRRRHFGTLERAPPSRPEAPAAVVMTSM